MDASTPKVNFDNFTDIDYIFDMAELANNELDSGLLAGLNEPMVQVPAPIIEPRVPATSIESLAPATTVDSQQQPIAAQGAGRVAGTIPRTLGQNMAFVSNGNCFDSPGFMLQQPVVNHGQAYPHAYPQQGTSRPGTPSARPAGAVHPNHVQYPGPLPHAQGWQGNRSPAQHFQGQPMGLPPSRFPGQPLGFPPSHLQGQHMGVPPQIHHRHPGYGYPPQHQLLAQQQFAMQPPMVHTGRYQQRIPSSGGSARSSPYVQANAFRAQSSRGSQQSQHQQRVPQHAYQHAQFGAQFPAQFPAHGYNGNHSPLSGFPLGFDSSHPLNQRQPGSLNWFPQRVTTSIGMKTPNFPVHPPYEPQHEQTEAASEAPKFPYPEPAIANSPVPAYGSPTAESVRLAMALAAGEEDKTTGAAVDINSPSQFLDLDAVPVPPVQDSMAPQAQAARHAAPMIYQQPGGYVITAPYGTINAQGYSDAFDAVDQVEELKVISTRALKKKGDPRCDPSRVYTAQISRPISWGPTTMEGCPLFCYTKDGKLSEGRSYTAEELRLYVSSGRAIMWLQQAPSQVANRLGEDDNKCRWEGCPVARRVISSGWLRVAFDEMRILTTDGTKDPFKYAGIMHLWCFEQCFDPAQFYETRRLRPEIRSFPKETGNAMTLQRDADREIVREAFDPWFLERLATLHAQGPRTTPREHKDTLSCRLTKYHLDNQTSARQKARQNRNATKPMAHKKTIDIHEGDLAKFIRISREAKAALRKEKSRLLQDSGGESGGESGEQALDPALELACDPALELHIRQEPQSPPSGNDTEAEQPATVTEHDAEVAAPIAAEGTVAATGGNPYDLLSPSEWQAKTPPATALAEYFNPLANFVARQASSPVLTNAAAVVGRASSSPALASAVVANINRAASSPAPGGNGTRASKRKRSDEDSPSEERDAKVQHVDKSTSKRKRGGSDEPTQGAAPKRQRTDPNTTEDNGMSEAAEDEVIVQPSGSFYSPLEDLFGESMGSQSPTAAAVQTAASPVSEQRSASVAEQSPARLCRHNARRSARQSPQTGVNKGKGNA